MGSPLHLSYPADLDEQIKLAELDAATGRLDAVCAVEWAITAIAQARREVSRSSRELRLRHKAEIEQLHEALDEARRERRDRGPTPR